ncbi:hypothetical protein PAXINDRAFT_21569 [Paxillus involutus ATCC 200175]|uniref:Uncharacterized protein n=1 Tax=Paxillus involutus ATCC 200175 TaxID=664439 RepID=A0A0C9SLW9_PAXIN|nr:hypothetical protein PAXINDRAFT_21569 [Paxillus involutus ATCC 200175]
MDAAFSANATMCEATSQRLREDLDVADERLARECERAARSDESIVSLECRVTLLQDELVARQRELTTAREQPQDCGASSFPQWGRGWGAYPSNFPSLRPQGSAFAAPSTVREQPALPQEVPPTTSKGEGASEACSSTSDSMTKGPSSCSKPTKATQWYTTEWSEDEPASDDTNNNWSTLTQMRSVGNSVVLTINKWEFVFSGEAAKNAQSTYQKGHLPPISQGMKHFRDSATPLTTDAIDRLFAHAREGRGKAVSQVEQYGHMLMTASEGHASL